MFGINLIKKNSELAIYESPMTTVLASTGKSVMAQLNSSKSDRYLDILLRESIQNSYDARVQGKIPSYSFNLIPFSNQQRIADLIRPGNQNIEDVDNLKEDIVSSEYVLEIADRNTTGLCGPYWQTDNRGNQIDAKNKNFLNLVYAFGQFQIKEAGSGGTNGVGKACYYIVSKCHTVGFYTKTRIDYEGIERDETRFIMVRLKESGWPSKFYYGDNEIHDMMPKPLLNEKADYVAKLFGLSAFKDDEYGTSIMILDPYFQDDEKDLVRYLKKNLTEAILFWFWPMLSRTQEVLNIDINIAGEKLDYRDTLSDGVFSSLYMLYKKWERCVRNNNFDGNNIRKVFYTGATDEFTVGYILFTDVAVDKSNLPERFREKGVNCFVARMRDIDFVVDYDNSFESEIIQSEYRFAMFHSAPNTFIPKTGKSIDTILRESENQSHDEWVARLLHTNAEKAVLKSIKDGIKSFTKENLIDISKLESSHVSSGLSLALNRFISFGTAPTKIRRAKRKKKIIIPTSSTTKKERVLKFDEKTDIAIKISSDGEERLIFIPYIREKKTKDKIVVAVYICAEDGTKFVNPKIAVLDSVKYYSHPGESFQLARKEAVNTYILENPGHYFLVVRTKGAIEFDINWSVVK